MTWKKWKIGLWIAIAFGLFNAGAGLVGDMGWKSFVAVLCASWMSNLGAYLMKHPVEDVQDTGFIARPSSDDPARLPLWFLVACLGLALTGCQASLGGKYGLSVKPLDLPARRIVNVSQSTIGINVGMNTATQTPEFQIGYKRFSGQIIPTSEGPINTVPFRVDMGVRKDGFDAGIAEKVESGSATVQTSEVKAAVVPAATNSLNLLRRALRAGDHP